MIPTKDLRLSAAIEINVDLCSIADWGRRWHIEFEPSKSNVLCVSLKRDVEEHPPLFMNGVPIKESKVLSILAFHFDSRLTWEYMWPNLRKPDIIAQYKIPSIKHYKTRISLKNLQCLYRAISPPW